MVKEVPDPPLAGLTLTTLSAHAASVRMTPPASTRLAATAATMRRFLDRTVALCSILQSSSIAYRHVLTVPNTEETRAPAGALVP
jgi:hypothetical protein